MQRKSHPTMHRFHPLAMAMLWFIAASPLSLLAQEANTVTAESSAAEPVTEETLAEKLRLAEALIHQGNPQQAIDEHLNPIIQHYKARMLAGNTIGYSARSPSETLFYMLTSAATQAEAKKAGQETRGAVTVSSIWSEAYYLKAYARVEQERFDEAKAVLQEALAISPLYPALWNELGAIYQEQSQWPQALDAYEQAESGVEIVYPDKSEQRTLSLTRALRGKGFVLIETGELKKAEKLYKRCLKMDPTDAIAKRELAYIANLKARKKRS
jgi:tetratricopeptide (TPR) repeat protein